MKTVDFSETIAACDLKVGRCRQLIEIMKVQSELLIPMNVTTENSTSNEIFSGTDLFLSNLLPYNGNYTYRHRQ